MYLKKVLQTLMLAKPEEEVNPLDRSNNMYGSMNKANKDLMSG